MKNIIISQLIKEYGGQAKLASLLGVTQGAVSGWHNQYSKISELNALKIEKLTNGKYKAVDLCPSLKGLSDD
ncbi:Cro/CI family transcriptional regulator [Moraxella sp.]|uniref:transcriptional regulator n=1 Tax=Moraxella sp. TaxID=479 RepID=UPI0026DC8F50|nr:Cro/CI family transcriptional regulator [Moraxella sp.]MDO4894997.1 Cro/CI family transcriptional regulator [Moraxella sp.]